MVELDAFKLGNFTTGVNIVWQVGVRRDVIVRHKKLLMLNFIVIIVMVN